MAGKSTEGNKSGNRLSMWRPSRRVTVAILILIALVAGLRFMVLRPPLVTIAEVTRGSLVGEIEGTGTVTADTLANISSKITGRVERVFFDEGDEVRVGQILATLDQTDLHWQVVRARAQLSAAVATARERQREWDREKEIVASGAVGIEESQQYQERSDVAQSAVQATDAELGYAKYQLSLAQIPSLSSGIVTKRWAVPGTSVVPGQPMFTVADTNLIYVNTNIDQNLTGKIMKGEAATIILRGREDQPLVGHVLRIAPQADQATEEMVAEVAFKITPDKFQLGQWANVYIQIGEAKDALLVPQTALMPMDNDVFVFVVDAKHKVRREPVTILARSPRTPVVAVAGHLHSGDHVVLMPMGLQPGETVRTALPKTGYVSGSTR